MRKPRRARPCRPVDYRAVTPGRRCLRRRTHHRRDVRHGQGLLRASGGRVGYAVTTGCAMGLCSLSVSPAYPPPHPARVRGSGDVLAYRSRNYGFGQAGDPSKSQLRAGPRPRCSCCNAACRQQKHGACHFSASSASRACPRFLLASADGIVRRSLVRLSPRWFLWIPAWIPERAGYRRRAPAGNRRSRSMWGLGMADFFADSCADCARARPARCRFWH